MCSNDPTTPQRLAEVPDITISPSPRGRGLAVGAIHDGLRVLYILPDPEEAPEGPLRDAVEARNVASVTRRCPACGVVDEDDLRAPIEHKRDCPAADANLNDALAAGLHVSKAEIRRRRKQSAHSFDREMSGHPIATAKLVHGGMRRG